MRKSIAFLLTIVIAIIPACAFAIGNPWTEMTAEEFQQNMCITINVPDGAEDVVWLVNDSDGIGEMQCTVNGANINVRVAVLKAFEDISGLYYDWTIEESGNIDGQNIEFRSYRGDEQDIDLVLFYDENPGIMYTVSAEAEDLDGFDITAIVQQIYVPMQ